MSYVAAKPRRSSAACHLWINERERRYLTFNLKWRELQIHLFSLKLWKGSGKALKGLREEEETKRCNRGFSIFEGSKNVWWSDTPPLRMWKNITRGTRFWILMHETTIIFVLSKIVQVIKVARYTPLFLSCKKLYKL